MSGLSFLGTLPTRLSSEFQKEWAALSREPDRELREASSLNFAGRLERAGEVEAAAVVYADLKQSASGSDSKQGAAKRLEAILGQGSFGNRFEFLAARFSKEATALRNILPMMVGTATFQFAKAFALTQGRNRLLANGFGLLFETPAFTLSSRALRQYSGENLDWSPRTLGKDLLSTALTLGALKTFGFAGEKAMGIARPWTKAAAIIPQVATFSGLFSAHHLETLLGLRVSPAGETLVADTLGEMLSLGVGGRLGHLFLGRAFTRLEAWNLALRENSPRQSNLPRRFPTSSPNLAAASLALCLAGCSAGGESSQAKPAAAVALSLGALAMAKSRRGQRAADKNPDAESEIKAASLQDPFLRELSESTSALQRANPNHPEIQQNFSVIADKLAEMNDPRGLWINLALQKARNGREYPEWTPNDHSISNSMQQIETSIATKALAKYGFKVNYGFNPSTGFQLTVESGSGVTPISFSQFLRDGFSFHLTSLNFQQQRLLKNAPWLLAASNLECLDRLNHLGFFDTWDRGAEFSKNFSAFLKIPVFDRLQTLALGNNFLGPTEVAQLADSRALRNLTSLDLSVNALGDEGVGALVRSPDIGRLRSLALDMNQLGDVGVRVLAESQAQNLRYLSLGSNNIWPEGAMILASSPTFKNLRHLNLGSNPIGLDGVQAILQSPHLRGLESLNMDISLDPYEKARLRERYPLLIRPFDYGAQRHPTDGEAE